MYCGCKMNWAAAYLDFKKVQIMTYAIFLLTDYLQDKFVHGYIIHCMIPITMFFFSLGTVSVHKIKGALNSVELMLAYINEWKVASLRTQ